MAYSHKEVGNTGEMLIVKHLEKRGFELIDFNFHRLQGEIDLVMRKGEMVHFIEVKTVLCETKKVNGQYVIRETVDYPVEERVNRKKRRKLAKVMDFYLKRELRGVPQWQFDIYVVYLDLKNKLSLIKPIKDIILDECL